MKIAILSDPTFELSPAQLARIDGEVVYISAKTAKISQIVDAEIIFGCPDIGLLKDCRALKWHHLPNAAIQPYTDPDLYPRDGVVLTNSSGVYGAVIAEHVVMMVTALARQLPLYYARRAERRWERDDFGTTVIDGARALIFGLGDLGLCAAEKLHALGMRVTGIRRSLLDKPPCVEEIFDLRSKLAQAARADFVIAALPRTSATEGIFDAEFFAAMKPSAYFINVGRGASVDQDALVAALRGKKIAGAALDVTEPEPPAENDPLWTLDNVILTPHSSGISDDVQERKLRLFLTLLERYAQGRSMPKHVNFRLGY